MQFVMLIQIYKLHLSCYTATSTSARLLQFIFSLNQQNLNVNYASSRPVYSISSAKVSYLV